MKPTPELAQALTNLRASPDFDTVLAFLASVRNAGQDKLERMDADPELYRLQGKCQMVRDFLELNEKAPRDLERFK